MKYLGFFIKPNDYRVSDCMWLIQKVEKNIGHSTYRWLYFGGRLDLEKYVLQNLLILWSLWEVFTSTCNPDENKIFREARRNPKALNITLEDKSA